MQTAVLQHGLLCAHSLRLDHPDEVARWVFEQMMPQLSCLYWWRHQNQGKIGFIHLPLPKGCHQTAQRFVCACQEHQPTHRPVNPVDRMQKDRPWFDVLISQVCFSPVSQGTVAGAIALNQPACRLVERQQVIILVDDHVHHYHRLLSLP